MNKSSALIIGVAIIVGCVILGMLLREPPNDDLEARIQDYEKRLSMQNGRYHLVSHGNYLMLLDSRSGRCWSNVVRHSLHKLPDWQEQSRDFVKTSKQK